MISVKEAQQLVLECATALPVETVHLEQAYGRTLAENVLADRDYPPFNRAAMDGYAFRSEELSEITEWEIVSELFAGYPLDKPVGKGQCLKIMTGAATPVELDCIVQVELAVVSNGKVSFPNVSLKSWQNIARKGEDCTEGDLILVEGTLLAPTEIATLAVLGRKEVKVLRNPKVAILSTGDELVPVSEPVSPFQIRDSNAYSLAAFFQSLHIPLTHKAIVRDTPEELEEALQKVMGYDIVILSGGVSMGDADYVPSTLQKMGVEKVFHKVELRPGKPIWFGQNPSGGVVFGLPGNPLSCQVCFKLFIEPYVLKCLGREPRTGSSYPISFAKKKKVKLDQYFPVKLKGGQLHPIRFNGSGDITSTLGSTGIALHPIEAEDLPEGSLVEYISWTSV